MLGRNPRTKGQGKCGAARVIAHGMGEWNVETLRKESTDCLLGGALPAGGYQIHGGEGLLETGSKSKHRAKVEHQN